MAGRQTEVKSPTTTYNFSASFPYEPSRLWLGKTWQKRKRRLLDLYSLHRSLNRTDLFTPLGDPNQYFDKVQGHLYVTVGDILADLYTVLQNVGQGAFSTVWICWDFRNDRLIALKICKGSKRDVADTRRERLMLETLRALDPFSQYIVGYFDCVMLRERDRVHRCMAFELLGLDLNHGIRSINNSSTKKGFHVNQVKALAKKLLECLSFLHDCCGIIHGDLKPHNILLFHPTFYFEMMYGKKPKDITNEDTLFSSFNDQRVWHQKLVTTEVNIKRFLLRNARDDSGWPCDLRLGDFGMAGSLSERRIMGGTPAYSSPELHGQMYQVIGTAADMWSAGCIIFQMATGTPLFDGSEPKKMLGEMGRFGPFPSEMKDILYSIYGDFSVYTPESSFEAKLKKEIECGQKGWTKDAIKGFAEFLKLMLSVNPGSRFCAKACLKHSWLIPE